MWKNLTDVSYLKTLLAKKGVRPRRSAGQHFLVCEEAVEATLLVLSNDVKQVTELGAGVGTLTQALLGAGYKVRAIEREAALGDLIKAGMSEKLRNNLDLVRDDLREADWSWREAYQLVGNIPYNLSGLIIRRLTLLEPAPERAVLLVQQEVGERLTAKVGNLSLVSVAVQLWGRAERLLNVPASCFWPIPKVDSQLVLLCPTTEVNVTSEEREAALAVAKKFFQAKRKQVGGVIRQVFNWPAEEAAGVLQQIGVKPTARPQEVPSEAWLALSRMVYSKR